MEERIIIDNENLDLVNGGVDAQKILKIAASTLGPIVKKWYAEGGLKLVKTKLLENGMDNLANLIP